jgi:prepilin-type N-terminal cleavage/methylation domain-containing protein
MRSHALREAGFSLMELLAALAIAGVIAAMTVPATTRTLADLRLHNDARALHNLLSLAKMRAAAKYSRERLYVDLTTESFFLQSWNKTTATWVTEEGAMTLSPNVDFGFDALAGPPADTQAALGEASPCLAGLTTASGQIANTACIVFNSRGIPVDGAGSPNGNGAFYVTDHETGVYGVTISATPLVRLWWSPHSTTAWVHK